MTKAFFEDIALDKLLVLAKDKKEAGYKCTQLLCLKTDDGTDMVYTFMAPEAQGFAHENYVIRNLQETDEIPSVTGYFPSAFPYENEAHDLFGMTIKGINIDFNGCFYKVAMDKPMTVISPAQKAAKEKAARIAAAKAAKAAKDKQSGAAAADDMEAKLAAMDPEKAAKVRAAMAAKAAKEKAAKDAELEEKLAGMDPEKAAKVRAAMAAKAAKEAAMKKDGE